MYTKDDAKQRLDNAIRDLEMETTAVKFTCGYVQGVASTYWLVGLISDDEYEDAMQVVRSKL